MARHDHGQHIRGTRRTRAAKRDRDQREGQHERIIKQIVRILKKHGCVFDAANEFDAACFLRREGALGRADHGFDATRVTRPDAGYVKITEALNMAVARGDIVCAESGARIFYAMPVPAPAGTTELILQPSW